MLGLSSSLVKGGASLLTFVKDNLKLYLDFKSNKSDTLKFPSEGSTSFDGSDDFVSVADSSSLQIAGNMTITAWVNPTGTTTNRVFVSKRDSGGTNYQFYMSNDATPKLRFFAGSDAFSSTDTLTKDGWQHVAISINSGVTNGSVFYINGIASGAFTFTISSNDAPLVIGKHPTSNTYYNGKMANVAIWSRALEQEEIQSIQNKSYSQLKGVEKTSLVSWWALDSQSNGLVQPATGETLGIEKITSNTETDWTPYGSNDVDPTTNGVSVTNSDNDARGAVYNISGLTNGSLYKVVFNARSSNLDGNLKTYFNASTTYFSPAISTTDTQYTIYGYAGSSNSFQIFALDPDNTIFIENFSVKEVTSNTGVVTGATTTTSVYGGNAPILPRAVDVAKEGQADAIGNGSASFNGSSDYVEFGTDVYDFSSGDFTLTAWIYHDTAHGAHSGIFGVRDSTNTEVQFYIRNSTDFLGSWNGSDNVYSSSAIPDEEWTHVAMVQSGSNKKFYINGILDNTASQSNGTARPATLKIGYTGHTTEYLKGNVSQAGIWAGELTQAQIQSVMESTSYSKIPADVKSTLGAETLTHDFSDGTGVTVPSELSVASGKTTFNGEMVVNGGDVSSAYYSIADNVTWDTSKLYKIVVVCSAYTSGALSHQGGSRAFGVTFGISSSIGGVGTFTNYAVPSSDGLITLRSQSFVGTLSSISIKEVTNDIVAYYPLDGDSSANGFTQDVTTGETLSDELFTGSSSSGNWTWDSSANTLTGTGVTNDAYSNVLSGVEEGDIVKVTFDITGFTGGGFYLNLAGGAYPSFSVANGSYTVYTISGSGTKKLAFDGSAPFTGVISNISAKKVTSNTGVLK